jgi:anti-anti-sigma factor
MHVAERLQDDALILMISGRVTFYSRKVFQALVRTAKHSSAKHVIFNLEGVTFLDSTALGGLALAYLNLQEGGIAMSLVSPQSDECTILDASHFRNLIPTYPTEERALEASLCESAS